MLKKYLVHVVYEGNTFPMGIVDAIEMGHYIIKYRKIHEPILRKFLETLFGNLDPKITRNKKCQNKGSIYIKQSRVNLDNIIKHLESNQMTVNLVRSFGRLFR